MCTNAAKTVASLMAAIEPTLKSILTFTNLINTPDGKAAIAAYDAALGAVEGWQSGTTAQNVLQLIGDFQTVFNAIPFPATVSALVNIILAGIETVIGVLTANSPAPAPVAAAGDATAEETQAMHQAHVAADTASKVTALVPGFKRNIFRSPASQYKKAWNDAVAQEQLPALKV
ncbi:MAG: hypothetical protein WBQ94_04240 [Terracidiphilus sp.]